MTEADALEIDEWYDGKSLRELSELVEERLRTIARTHSIALGRVLDELTGLANALAKISDQAASSGETDLYALGVVDGLSRALHGITAIRDSLGIHLDGHATNAD